MGTVCARRSLDVLLSAHTSRENDIGRQSSQREAESDDEVVETWLIDFTGPEFRGVYSKLHESILTNWNIGRGRRSSQNR